MKRLLTLASSSLIATGLAILPAASFAQTATDAARTQPSTTSPAATAPAAPAVGAATTTQFPASTPKTTDAGKKDAALPRDSKPQVSARSDARTHAKPDVHSLNTAKPHDGSAKTSPADQKS